MNSEKLIRVIEKKFNKSNETFFAYSWREKIENILKDESRYSRLVDWINEKIDFDLIYVNTFNPADKNEKYSKSDFKVYLEACQNIAMLINLKWIMLNKNSSIEMRDNIEYAICSHFKIHYNKELNKYL